MRITTPLPSQSYDKAEEEEEEEEEEVSVCPLNNTNRLEAAKRCRVRVRARARDTLPSCVCPDEAVTKRLVSDSTHHLQLAADHPHHGRRS